MTVIGLLYSAVAGGVVLGTQKGIEGFFAGMAFWLAFYVLGWLGAGDVKLVGAAGAWLGGSGEGNLIRGFSGAILALLWL